MIIAWIFFVISSLCTFVWLLSSFLDSKEEIKKRKSYLNFWMWLIIASCCAQYIWG